MSPSEASLEVAAPRSPADTSIDLWKFFEERGGKLKESMFSVVTWIMGLAAAVFGFAVSEGFEAGLARVGHPMLVASIGVVGLLILVHATLVVCDYGGHINRTFERADKARDGEWKPKEIWHAGQEGEKKDLPLVCRHLLIVISLFAIGFALLIVFALIRLLWDTSPLTSLCSR